MRNASLFLAAIAIAGLVPLTGCGESRGRALSDGSGPDAPRLESLETWTATAVARTAKHVGFTWDERVTHGGERSVSIAIADSHPDEVIAYNWYGAMHGYEVGASYELSGWVKCENLNDTMWICVQCWNDGRNEMLEFASTQADYRITGTSDWTRVMTVFTVPPGTADVCVRAGIAAPGCRGGRAWFDDFSIREVR